MKIDFQQNLLRFLVQQPEGVEYIEHLTEDLFSYVELQLALQILQVYYKNYKSLPTQNIADKFLQDQIAATPEISPEVQKDLEEVFEDLYIPLQKSEIIFLKDHLAETVRNALTDNLYADYAEGKITPDQLWLRINHVFQSFKQGHEDSFTEGGFLVKDKDVFRDETIVGHPCFLEDLNRLTAAGGFYSPQLVIMMAGTKGFKTGTLIKLAVEYARMGYSVYYADVENSARDIRLRSKQAIMECTLEELNTPEIKDTMDRVLDKFGKTMGGDLYIDSYPAYTKCMLDVESRLEVLKESRGFIPQVIIYDSIDHFIPNNNDDRRRDLRLQISKVYHEAINLNKKIGSFCFVPSQVNRAAVEKKIFTMKDVAESFDKIMNAHAAFAICASPEELELGLRRIIPVAQRSGKAYKGKNFCVVKVDEERMKIDEVDRDALDQLETVDDE